MKEEKTMLPAWLCKHGTSSAVTWAQTWFLARAAGAVLLGAPALQVECVPRPLEAEKGKRNAGR
jgi:hypothetical protein